MNEMSNTNRQQLAPHSSSTMVASRSRGRSLWMSLVAVLCLTMFLSIASSAQVSGGSITGTLTDPTGAVVPGAKVTIVNRGTGIGQTLTTTSTGLFNKPNLDPGTYDVTFEAGGFATMKTEALVDVGHDTVLDIKLQVASGTQVVNVTTATSSVDLGSAQLNQTV